MFVAAIAPAVMLGALFAFPPAMIGPMYEEPPDPVLPAIVIGVGMLGYVVGLAAMIRIYRTDPEAGPSRWRFRDY